MITLSDLHFNYRKKPVLKGLNLEFQPGHIYGLLGSNGTGKSTLLKNMAGTLFPKEGKIDVFGYKPGERKPDYLQKLFMLPEEFYLPGITIKRLIKGLAPFYPSFSKDDFYKYLYEFEIPLENSIDDMSLGEKKKTFIAFGLACNTDLLLLDEPTNGLDIVSKGQFRKIMATLIEPSRYVIISTHQVQDLENLIDRIIIIDNGKVAFDQSMQIIAQKLSFGVARESYEYEQALYAEQKLKGSAIVSANHTGEESRVDLELLYKSVLFSNQAIKSQFN